MLELAHLALASIPGLGALISASRTYWLQIDLGRDGLDHHITPKEHLEIALTRR